MTVMKKACQHCPFRKDVRPFLHPDRAAEIAYSAQNRYSDFPCHKTIEHDDETGEGFSVETSQTCAGFYQLRMNEGTVEMPSDYVWDNNIYSDVHEMCGAYEDEWKRD